MILMDERNIITESVLSEAFSKCLDDLPHYKNVATMLCGGFDDDIPNQLLYGAKGLPHTLLWDAAVFRKYGAFRRQSCVWNKQWIYEETPYFFEIDLAHPSQPKDLETLGDFLKEILVHTCMTAQRHVFFIKNLDVVCSKKSSGMFRVLLERYANTAWFVCSTYHLGGIEGPLCSRFSMTRVVPPTHTDIEMICNALSIAPPPCYRLQQVPSLPFTIYLTSLAKYQDQVPYPLEDLCTYNAPFLRDLKIQTGASCNIEEIRALTQKLTIHGYSISEITQDVLATGIIKPARMHDFITFASKVDHMCARTEKYRKALFIEWLLAVAVFGIDPPLLSI